jgi:5-methylcytosine-specific restriction protein B
MSIPINITKDHLLSAIAKIDQDGIPNHGDSQFYDVEYNGKKYPPKLIVSLANLFANGEILDRNSFEGGIDTACFKLLEENGFIIIPKKPDDTKAYSGELKKFIAQADDSDSLATKSYLNNFRNLKVEVSFGKGNQVYLYFKERKLLILSYGVSETKPPNRNWNIKNPKSITQYFNENQLGKPERYGSSFIYKTYDTNKIKDDEINYDLNNLINEYLSIPNPEIRRMPIKAFQYQTFTQSALNAGLFFDDKISLRLVASILTKPFVILTGLSGSGKTKLAQAFAMWICENEDQYCIVPVGADWTNREPILGYPNALEAGKYVVPENGALQLIIDASNDSDNPYFLILDEMNLSHVERYLADFLSAMESSEEIPLHSDMGDWKDSIPSKIKLPKNLFIIGTVNIDETTYMFSPKVLDRANVIEFRVSENEMESYLKNYKPLDLDLLKSKGANMGKSFVEIAAAKHTTSVEAEEMNTALIAFFSELKKSGAEFGYRSAAEIIRFVSIVNTIEPAWALPQIIDAAIMQKLLPKVHGSRRKLEPILDTLGKLCLQSGEKIEDYIAAKHEIAFDDLAKIKYPLSLEKILRMRNSLISNGFTSYAEA